MPVFFCVMEWSRYEYNCRSGTTRLNIGQGLSGQRKLYLFRFVGAFSGNIIYEASKVVFLI